MSLRKVTSILCILAVAESLTLNCPRQCIGAEIQLTCQSNVQNLKTFSWTYNGEDLSTNPRFHVTDVDKGASTLTFINLPFDNDTHIVCGEVFISGSGDRETCNVYVDPIPPVTYASCRMISRYSLNVSWNEPPCLPKFYNYSITITNKNTTIEKHTPKLFLTQDVPSCADLVISVTVVHTGFTDNSTSVPAVKDFKVGDQKRNIRLNNSFYEYMDMGNSCFSLKFKIYSELYWFCQGMLYITFDSSNLFNISQPSKFLHLNKSAQKVDVPIEICMNNETEITVFIRRIDADEKIEIVVYDHGAHDEGTIPWNGGVVNVSLCTLRNNNTSLTGTGCYLEGILIKSNWSSSFVIFNDNNTAALFVFNVPIQAQYSSSYNSPISPFGSTPSPSVNITPSTSPSPKNFKNVSWIVYVVVPLGGVPVIVLGSILLIWIKCKHNDKSKNVNRIKSDSISAKKFLKSIFNCLESKKADKQKMWFSRTRKDK